MALAIILLLLIGAVAFFTIVPREVAKWMNPVVSPPPYDASKRATQLHQSLFIADLHADSLLWNRDLLDYGTYGHVDIPRLIKGNVALQAFTVVTKVPRGRKIAGGTPSDSLDLITLLSISQLWPVSTWTSLKQRALYQSGRLHETAARSNGKLVLVKSSRDLEQYVEQRKDNPNMVGGFLGIEGAHCLEGKLENVDVLFDAGFRMMGLTHHFDNELGCSAHGERKCGLSQFGKQVVQRMQELKMTVDLAHASSALTVDVLDMATRPILVSHTGVRGTCNNQRNLSDEQIRRIAQTGGVIGIGYWATAVCGTDAESIAKAIRYTADLVGVDHVALGSDYDGAVRAAFDTTGIVQITEALLAQDFSEGEIRKMMGENVLRGLKEALPKE
ncbi:MAG: dipeptidase [Candidatus Binatia bacterium]